MDERYPDETQTLRELLALMHEHDLDSIKVKLGDAVYELSRRGPELEPAPQPSAVAPIAEASSGVPANVTRIAAPLTGVFYRAASPDTPAFVDVGDRVDVGDVLCVLEAMKLFNEIQSDYAGTIVRVVPGNGELVSQGEDLFWLEARS